MDILSAENIKKSFDEKVILDGVNLTLQQGELISLLGVSGAGKTTLFNCISGIDRPDSGRVVLGGEDITGQPGHISYMLQKDLLLPYKKIIDNVSLPLLLSGKSKKEARTEAGSHFAQFGLEGTQQQYPAELSGGMRQRAALLRRQIGGQHRQGLGLQETGQFAASFVELMIAQGHGVVGQQRVRSGDHGPFVDAVEQGALELVARVQGDDVVLLLPGSLDGCAAASQAAAAVRGLETGVHVLIDTGKKGMGIIHVQEAQLQTCSRGCLAVRGSAGNHEEEKSTEEGR